MARDPRPLTRPTPDHGPPEPSESLLEALLELQALDRVHRSGYQLRGVPDAESVAEHGYHLALLVWALGRELPDLDVGRALALALVHDVAEVRLGDLPRPAGRYLPPGAKRAAEAAVMADLLPGDGEALFAEYDRAESRESRFVHACDKLQLMLKVTWYERWGWGTVGEFWDHPANFPDREFEPVARLFDELRARRRSGRVTSCE